jgi:hypothetical protein
VRPNAVELFGVIEERCVSAPSHVIDDRSHGRVNL